MSEHRFIALGLGRYVRADRVVAVVPVEGESRGPGHRTLVWLEGMAEPVVASRGEHRIMVDLVGGEELPLLDSGDEPATSTGEAPPSLF